MQRRALANLDFLAEFAKLSPYPLQLGLLAHREEDRQRFLRVVAPEPATLPILVSSPVGDVMRQLLAAPIPAHLEYLGADIQSSLDDVPVPHGARIIRHNMMQTLEGEESFDFVICRAAWPLCGSPHKAHYVELGVMWR